MPNKQVIIDFSKKGNVVRFYLGKERYEIKDKIRYEKPWGDDWDDAPYERNASEVYDEYVDGVYDVAFPYDYMVLEPCDGDWNSPYTKEDMQKRKMPCILIVPPDVAKADYYTTVFNVYVGDDRVAKVYFGDTIDALDGKGTVKI